MPAGSPRDTTVVYWGPGGDCAGPVKLRSTANALGPAGPAAPAPTGAAIDASAMPAAATPSRTATAMAALKSPGAEKLNIAGTSEVRWWGHSQAHGNRRPDPTRQGCSPS